MTHHHESQLAILDVVIFELCDSYVIWIMRIKNSLVVYPDSLEIVVWFS